MPDAVPYVTSYYKRNWGFCLSQKQKKKLPKGNFKVVIDSELKKGLETLKKWHDDYEDMSDLCQQEDCMRSADKSVNLIINNVNMEINCCTTCYPIIQRNINFVLDVTTFLLKKRSMLLLIGVI